ncbi:hypothetical protein TWF106_005655 [Orbilia oligospora]|uniref:Apple domain-containing protein n=1 Tax=Orbilia oligospora TaxID=2813651 RepID=A0A6G1M820_ORBOL|nr:hypothetical protein TWF788_003641 [Orbilia oligospora]KAF3222238.1 hypothetical protein TWF106_005655 [Orbilia oligospora]KAF3225179.1 hypothetical protein TWF191_005469 [Orbilia oligospora]KAF3249162.1 hypothetical protein TWF192_006104 [Orbilia oligospora]
MRFNILSIVALPVLLGCVDGVLAGALSCKPAAKSCAASARQAAPCTSLFLKNKVKRPTCTVIPAPVTVTKKVTPAASTKLVTITRTVSTTRTKTLPTVTITETTEVVEVETSVTSAIVFSTEVDTTTTIVETTTIYPDYNFTCTNRKRDALPTAAVEIDGLVKRTPLPKCCGCFLTSTKTAARQTKTVTKTLPKATVTKKITKTVTSTSIVTAIPNSSTIFETTTETITTTRTDTETQTETTTETAPATQTSLYDICENPYTYSGRNAFEYRGTSGISTPINVNTLSKCCALCFESMNCANFIFDTITTTCTIHQITNADVVQTNCFSKKCNIGRATGSFSERPNNELYGVGPCGGSIVR